MTLMMKPSRSMCTVFILLTSMISICILNESLMNNRSVVPRSTSTMQQSRFLNASDYKTADIVTRDDRLRFRIQTRNVSIHHQNYILALFESIGTVEEVLHLSLDLATKMTKSTDEALLDVLVVSCHHKCDGNVSRVFSADLISVEPVFLIQFGDPMGETVEFFAKAADLASIAFREFPIRSKRGLFPRNGHEGLPLVTVGDGSTSHSPTLEAATNISILPASSRRTSWVVFNPDGTLLSGPLSGTEVPTSESVNDTIFFIAIVRDASTMVSSVELNDAARLGTIPIIVCANESEWPELEHRAPWIFVTSVSAAVSRMQDLNKTVGELDSAQIRILQHWYRSMNAVQSAIRSVAIEKTPQKLLSRGDTVHSAVVHCVSVAGENVLLLRNVVVHSTKNEFEFQIYVHNDHNFGRTKRAIQNCVKSRDENPRLVPHQKVVVYRADKEDIVDTCPETLPSLPNDAIPIITHTHYWSNFYHTLYGSLALTQMHLTRVALTRFTDTMTSEFGSNIMFFPVRAANRGRERYSAGYNHTTTPLSTVMNSSPVSSGDIARTFVELTFGIPELPELNRCLRRTWVAVGLGGTSAIVANRRHLYVTPTLQTATQMVQLFNQWNLGLGRCLYDRRTSLVANTTDVAAAASPIILHMVRNRVVELHKHRVRGIDSNLSSRVISLLQQDAVDTLGYEIEVVEVKLETLSLIEQYELIRRAKYVLSSEGASFSWQFAAVKNSTWVMISETITTETRKVTSRHVQTACFFHIVFSYLLNFRLLVFEIDDGKSASTDEFASLLRTTRGQPGTKSVQPHHKKRRREKYHVAGLDKLAGRLKSHFDSSAKAMANSTAAYNEQYWTSNYGDTLK